MAQIGLGEKYLYGYVNGNRVKIANTVEQICAFIVKHGSDSVIITDVLDNLEIQTSMGLIFYCKDQEFLREELLPVLVPMQTGLTEAPEFIPYVSEEEYVVNNVRMKSGAGYYLGSLIFNEGYPEPYDRLSGYFPSEEAVFQAFPDSISFSDAVEQAKEKGWI